MAKRLGIFCWHIGQNIYEQIVAFFHKLQLIQKQMSLKIVHFPTLFTTRAETANHAKYSELLANLLDEFTHTATDFKEYHVWYEAGLRSIWNKSSRKHLPMELADIQNDSQVKRASRGMTFLLSFYRQYVSPQTFPNLSYLALRYIALFGSNNITVNSFFLEWQILKQTQDHC